MLNTRGEGSGEIKDKATHLVSLEEIGFKKAVQWKLDGNDLGYDVLLESLQIAPALYAHVVDGMVMYVGKTSQTLGKRLQGYRNPGKSQTTNDNCNRHIKGALGTTDQVFTYGFFSINNRSYGPFSINLCAGLEDSIVRQLSPPWNKVGVEKRLTTETEEAMRQSQGFEYEVKRNVLYSSTFRLENSYYYKGFLNLGVEVSKHLALQDELMTVYLGRIGLPKTVKFDRRANKNGSVRIYGGKELTGWFQSNFALGSVITVEVLGSIEMLIF